MWKRFSLALVAPLLLIILILWIYWPGQYGPALLDDFANTLAMPSDLANPAVFWYAITSNEAGPSGRPVAVLTFALEALVCDDVTRIGKAVNVVLHGINGALLFLIGCVLFQRGKTTDYATALVVAALWLLAPLQVSTVLYHVQRMAILAATFSLLAVLTFFWLRARYLRGASVGFPLALFLLCWGLAVLSKENTITLPVIIFLLEVLVLQRQEDQGTERSRMLGRASVLGLAFSVALLLIMFFVLFDWVVAGYISRDFSFIERVLSQPRILWDYMRQFFHPNTASLGLYHDDFLLSKGFFDPLSTLFSIIAWLITLIGLLAGCVMSGSKILAGLCFGILFFCVTHAVESGVLALELYFEHRNYLPSVGLSLAVGYLLNGFSTRHAVLKAPLLLLLGIYLLRFSFLTSSQVIVWSSNPLLVMNDVSGHPESARANLAMAVYAATVGDYDTAVARSDRANRLSSKETEDDNVIRKIALACISDTALSGEQLDKVLFIDDFGTQVVHTALASFPQWISNKVCPRFPAIRFANVMAIAISRPKVVDGIKPQTLLRLAAFEGSLGRNDRAYQYSLKATRLAPDDPQALLMNLFFALESDRVGAADRAARALSRLEAAGVLTVLDRNTFASYRALQGS